MPKVYHFNVPSMSCPACVPTILNAIKDCEGIKVTQVTANEIEKKFRVTIDDCILTEDEIRNKINSALADIGELDCENFSSIPTFLPKKNHTTSTTFRAHLWKGIFGSLCGIGILILSASGLSIPLMGMYIIGGLSSALTLILGANSYYKASRSLIKNKSLTMETLFAVSTLTAITVSIASFFFPWLPQMFDVGLLIFGFRHIGKAIEESVKQKVTSGLRFRDRVPKDVFINPSLRESTPVRLLKPGDIIYVKANEIIPADGECLDDRSSVYETILTGAHSARTIKKGHRLLSGMRVAPTMKSLKIRVTAPAANSYLARLDAELENAINEKAPIETSTSKILKYFVPTVFALAAIAGTLMGIFLSPGLAIQCMVSILTSACPCTLGFITPLSIQIGMAKIREHGIHLKTSKELEAAANIDTVVFDLNGTLTMGKPVVSSYNINSDIHENEFFSYLKLLESHSKHAVAKAIVDFTNTNKTVSLENLELRKIHHSAFGIEAEINSDRILLGNKTLLAQHGIIIPSCDSKHTVYLVRNSNILGKVRLEDPLRSDAKATVKALKKAGKKIYICTGAENDTAQYYAKKLNIESSHVIANCAGGKADENTFCKSDFITRLKKTGKQICMVGDGPNDALALTSTLGVAIKSNSSDELTQQQAGVVINTLKSLHPLFSIASQTVKNIKQNLTLSLGYNMTTMIVIGVLTTLGFALNPGIGAALMILQTNLLLLNAYRFKNKNLAELVQVNSPVATPNTTFKLSKQLTPQPNHQNKLPIKQVMSPKSTFTWNQSLVKTSPPSPTTPSNRANNSLGLRTR